jgi:alkylation response protein AidB-like acyl-CoA dehydrogenase
LHYKLTKEQESLRSIARKVAQEKVAKGANERDEKGDYPWDMVEVFRQNNFYALSIPEQYGGLRGKVLDLCIVIEEIGKFCNSCTAMLSFAVLGPYPTLLSGNDDQKKKYLPGFATGRILGAYALSELTAGSDAASLQTSAVLEGAQYRINGEKRFISNFDVSSVCIVFARTNPETKPSRGISAFIAEKEPNKIPPWTPKARSMPKMGMRAMHTFELTLKDLKVPKSSLLGNEGDGFKIAMATLDRGRLCTAAQGVGTACGALEYALNYASNRKQFGVPIGAFQGLQFMLADMAMETEAARQLLYMAASHADEGGSSLALYGAMAKCFATDVAMRVTTEAVQTLGGNGYIRDFPLERLMRDAKAMQIYEGTNQIQRIVVARSLLGRL